MPDSLSALEQHRALLLDRLRQLGDLRPGSITGTGGRCGSARCHCHREGDPGHPPHPRLTYKLGGRTVTESFPTPAAQRKAEQEIAEFRRYQELSRAFLEVSEKICRLRPVEEPPTAVGTNRRQSSPRKSLQK